MPTILITGASSSLAPRWPASSLPRATTWPSPPQQVTRSAWRSCATRSTPWTPTVASIRALDVTDDDAVFEVFRAFAEDFGTLDRIIINAGLGKGARLGTGKYYANRQTAMTNFVAALCQAEAAMEIFRAQKRGHLVFISSMSAMRGLPKTLNVYAATKAGVAHLAEGLRSEMQATPDLDIVVSTIYPGYIRSEMNSYVESALFMVDTESGVRAIVAAIEAEKADARVHKLALVADGHRDEVRTAGSRSAG